MSIGTPTYKEKESAKDVLFNLIRGFLGKAGRVLLIPATSTVNVFRGMRLPPLFLLCFLDSKNKEQEIVSKELMTSESTDKGLGLENAVSHFVGTSTAAFSSLLTLSDGRRSSDGELLAAAGKTALYFVLLFLTWVHSIRDLFRVGWPRYPVLSLLLLGLGLYNVIAAWALIFSWLSDEFYESKLNQGDSFTWEDWFVEIQLFQKAYEMVIATFYQWFWSSQLLHFVSSLVVFTYIEFHRSDAVRPLSNFWLGCVAAISLCFPYVLYIVANTKLKRRRERLFVPFSGLLVVCMVVANVAVILLPRVEDSQFGPVLAALHLSLCVPLGIAQIFPSQVYATETEAEQWSSRFTFGTLWAGLLYTFLAGVALCVQIFNVLTAVGAHSDDDVGVVRSFWDAFCANPSQCSISNDVLRTSLLFMLFLLWVGGSDEHGRMPLRYRLLLTLLTPLLSVGVTFPVWAAYRELHLRVLPQYTVAERIQRMFLKYEPSRAARSTEQVEQATKALGGKARTVLHKLILQYGLEPLEPNSWLVAGAKKQMEVEKQLKAPVVASLELIPIGELNSTRLSQVTQTLHTYYTKVVRKPEKVNEVKKILSHWKTRSLKELFASLDEKYHFGVDPAKLQAAAREKKGSPKASKKKATAGQGAKGEDGQPGQPLDDKTESESAAEEPAKVSVFQVWAAVLRSTEEARQQKPPQGKESSSPSNTTKDAASASATLSADTAPAAEAGKPSKAEREE